MQLNQFINTVITSSTAPNSNQMNNNVGSNSGASIPIANQAIPQTMFNQPSQSHHHPMNWISNQYPNQSNPAIGISPGFQLGGPNSRAQSMKNVP